MKQRLFTMLTAGLLLAGLYACQNPATFFLGRTVEPHLDIPLTGAPVQEGVWQTFDMQIDYTLRNENGRLLLDGTAELGDHYKGLYNRVRYLDLYLFLLDQNATVIETVPLSTVGLMNTEDVSQIRAEIAQPAALHAVSFGYRGSVTALDGYARFDELPWGHAPQ